MSYIVFQKWWQQASAVGLDEEILDKVCSSMDDNGGTQRSLVL